ncbi:MAG TPA: cobalamin-binding protein [Chloroflexota bacterium]|jgi:iron complex transport system substrate-binding protein|nr:cobalamin-binding protein [Chloroflexota bacterium]
MRIVSLLPSATEILYALGAQDQIVGLSHDSDYPPEVRQKPLVSTSTVTDEMSSAEIDQAVGETYHRGASIYHIDPGFLEREKPDLIIAQELCQVCAVTSAEARRAAELARSRARILSLEPSTLADAIESIRTLGYAVDRSCEADRLVEQLLGRISAVAGHIGDVSPRPGVLCLGWLDPLIAEGHWLPELVKLAGGSDLLGEAGGHSRRLTPEEVVACAPEVVVLMPCSFGLQRTLAEANVLAGMPGWGELPAVRAGRVHVVPESLFTRPGPRLADGLSLLASLLHPERAIGAAS